MKILVVLTKAFKRIVFADATIDFAISISYILEQSMGLRVMKNCYSTLEVQIIHEQCLGCAYKSDRMKYPNLHNHVYSINSIYCICISQLIDLVGV